MDIDFTLNMIKDKPISYIALYYSVVMIMVGIIYLIHNFIFVSKAITFSMATKNVNNKYNTSILY
jgi:hypothetical protein